MFFSPLRTGKISDHLDAVKVGMVNFFVYKDDEDTICIDSGFRKSEIIRELSTLHIDPADVTHLFMTHSDYDHAGGLDSFEKAKVYLSSDEEQMITRRKARQLGLIYNSSIGREYTLLNDNEIITVGSIKISAIATPGHTPGSMSYLLNDHILFTGDTICLRDNKVYPFKRFLNMDTQLQKESIRKLARLGHVQMACTAHTGYTEEFDKAIADWK
ncbi:MAG TPA: MBL fold metallo-hydrolase [Spirochaetia bacterium]|nr:MBL fold metallo-hydrolase [Spirochaetia bacterium]